jgi:hypothetical protein
MNQRPVSITVLSIIGLVLGGLGLLGTCWSFVATFANLNRGNPMTEALLASTFYKAYVGVAGCFGLCVTALLIASCIGSLKLMPWARMGMNLYAVLSIFQALVGAVITFIWIIPLMLESMPAGTPPEVRTGMRIGAYFSPCFMLAMLVYPICVLIFFNRRVAANAFRGIIQPSPTDFPIT